MYVKKYIYIFGYIKVSYFKSEENNSADQIFVYPFTCW